MAVSTIVPFDAASQQWATQTFGDADMGDTRRTDRLVAMATALATNPAASLPRQVADPAALKATYRLLANDAVTFDAILAPHRDQTRARTAAAPVTLLVQDTTEFDFTAHSATAGLAPVGNGTGQGFHLQTVLAVEPATGAPLGVLAAEPWLRTPAPPGETRAQRQRRPRESDVWGRLVRAGGTPPTGGRWVHVADRGADCYAFFTACLQTETDLLVRVVANRRVTLPDGQTGLFRDVLRAQPPLARRTLTIPAQRDRSARETEVAVSWTPLTLHPPRPRGGAPPPVAPLPVWALRVWEPRAPDGMVPLEWLLVTTVPVVTVAEAWERVDWYTQRWLIEELHRGLKSGCRLEATQLRDRQGMWRLLAILLPVAVRVLQLRAATRQAPYAPVDHLADADTVRLVAHLTGQPPATTVARFAAQVARLGGYQDRRGDGPPGWQTLWYGWQRVQTLLEDVRLVATLTDA